MHMNKNLFILTLLVVSIASSFGIALTSTLFIAVAQSEGQNNMTDNQMSNMSEQLSMQGEILHDR